MKPANRQRKNDIKYNVSLNEEQKLAKQAIIDNQIVIITGRAGSGKSLVGAITAIDFLNQGMCNQILVTRSAIEVGRTLGYLTGDLNAKFNVYIEALVDNLYKCMDKLRIDDQSDVTYEHPIHPEWVGTPDSLKYLVEKVDTVTDTKCPLTLKNFYNLIKFLYDFDGFTATKKTEIDGDQVIQQIRKQSKEGEKYYWQLVSNACILGAKYAELIAFVPYFEELETIKKFNQELAEPYHNILFAKDGELPFIHKESGVENLNIIRFEVPEEDKKFLTERVKLAIEKINQ